MSLPLPPGQAGLPFLGETLSFFRDSKFAQRRHERYGPIFRTSLLGQPTLFVRGVEANRFILTHENDRFQVSWPPSTSALLGSLSLALQGGGIHQQRRKLLAQAFLPRALSGYIPTMEAITKSYLQRWTEQKEFTWHPELRQYTFDIAAKLLVGLDQGSQSKLGHYFEDWAKGLFSIPLPLPWTVFGRAKRSRRLLLAEIERLIRQRQQQPIIHKNEDALSLLIQAEDENGDRLSIEELKDQILLLLFAGHETLASAVTAFCLLMAQHPEVMTKVRAEQQQFAIDQPLTLDALKQMTYLEQVIREVLRLVPPAGGGFRKVLETCELGGYQIPKGWRIIYHIGSTHQDSSLYTHPDRFDPDRFSPAALQQQSIDQQKYGYVPFGGGIRECLGKEFARLEIKIFAAYLARYAFWELLPDQNLDFLTVPTPAPRDGLKVRFKQQMPVSR